MADLGLDATQETRITVMQLKIERLEEKQEELRERLKVVEKWGNIWKIKLSSRKKRLIW